MTRKEELIFLLESFKNSMIELDYFCSEFYRVFFEIQKDTDKLTQNEETYMRELALMCAKYTSNDYNLSTFYSEKDLLTKIGAWRKVKQK